MKGQESPVLLREEKMKLEWMDTDGGEIEIPDGKSPYGGSKDGVWVGPEKSDNPPVIGTRSAGDLLGVSMVTVQRAIAKIPVGDRPGKVRNAHWWPSEQAVRDWWERVR